MRCCEAWCRSITEGNLHAYNIRWFYLSYLLTILLLPPPPPLLLLLLLLLLPDTSGPKCNRRQAGAR